MTNRERLESKASKDFAEELKKLFGLSYIKYIDLESYFDGEDPNIFSYLISIGEVSVVPTPAEIQNYRNEKKLSSGLEPNFNELYTFTKNNTKTYKYLGESVIFGRKNYIIFDKDAEKIMKIPEEYVTLIKKTGDKS